ncbi:PD-(D/E)XK nuclease family transposase [Methylocucumis oryzae]|uniref:PD-(D/E)XK nuclease family transposase n=1 Tax=Methylocucumis oryzae TaxID=1632867 RepID=UPI000B167343|nr:PD-(D/E)XK nuclease family transposase [Methylocucumis oryzae]
MPLFTLQEHELSTHFDKWVYFLKNLEHFDHIPAILNEPIFQKGFEIAELSHLTPHQLDSYQRSLIEYAEVRNVSDTSFEEGLVKGEQIGIEKGEKIGIEKGEKIGIEKGEKIGLEKGAQNTKLAIAKALKDQQVPIDIIEATTGLTEQEIKTL